MAKDIVRQAARAKAWEIREGESSAEFSAFSIGLAMDPDERSLPAIAARTKRSLRTVETWSSKNKWTARFKAYDARQAIERRKRMEERRAEVMDQVFEAATSALIRFRLWDTNESASDGTMTAAVQLQRGRLAIETLIKLAGTPQKIEIAGPNGIPLGDTGRAVSELLERLAELLVEFPEAHEALMEEFFDGSN